MSHVLVGAQFMILPSPLLVNVVSKEGKVRRKSHFRHDLLPNSLRIGRAWKVQVGSNIRGIFVKRVTIDTDVKH